MSSCFDVFCPRMILFPFLFSVEVTSLDIEIEELLGRRTFLFAGSEVLSKHVPITCTSGLAISVTDHSHCVPRRGCVWNHVIISTWTPLAYVNFCTSGYWQNLLFPPAQQLPPTQNSIIASDLSYYSGMFWS